MSQLIILLMKEEVKDFRKHFIVIAIISEIWFGLDSLIDSRSTFQCQSYPCRRTEVILFNPWVGRQRFHTFSKGICQKVNVKARLEFELIYYNVKVQPVSHYNTWTPH